MPERLYFPSDYVDEVVPLGRASPDAWIGAATGDVWLLATEEGLDFGLTLAPGQIVLFDWVERLGAVAVEIRDDGTHVARGPVPAGVTHFSFGTELLADSLAEFVSEWRVQGLELDADKLVLVDMARWSSGHERFEFQLSDRGPRFIRAAPARSVAP